MASPTNDFEPELELALREIVSKIGDTSKIGAQTALLHDLGIGGDDAFELLKEVHLRFGTSFSALHFPDYFPGECDAIEDHILRALGFGRKWKRLTFGHLVTVVRAGAWFEP